jgi:hypothetical protein
MHIEFLVEDASGKLFLEAILPQIWPGGEDRPSWRIHSYKGVGALPKDLQASADPAKRHLLNQLPRLLNGYGLTPGIDAVVVVLDSDRRDCCEFLTELREVETNCASKPKITLFRLAIEEMEAWYLGDRDALLSAFPKAKTKVLDNYKQDSVCGTWEVLADAVHAGGAKALSKGGWVSVGQFKCNCARVVGPKMNVDDNDSPSFRKFRDGLRRLTT